MTTIEFDCVSKIYRDRQNRPVVALQEVSLRVDDGETVVVVGPSGSGKSSLLRILAGLELATSGQLKLGGAAIGHLSAANRRLAMVFQGAALVPHLTVEQNLRFGLGSDGTSFFGGGDWRASVLGQWWNRVSGTDRRWAKASADDEGSLDISGRIHQVAKRLGLGELLGRFPDQLSGGERQRVALGRAIARDPAAFLFDEPLSGLDLRGKQRLQGEIRSQLKSQNATALWVTHDQSEAWTVADRVAVLIAGRLEQIAAPAAVYRMPASRRVAEFFGPYPLNWLRGWWQANDADADRSGRIAGRSGWFSCVTPAWRWTLAGPGLGSGDRHGCGREGRGQVQMLAGTGGESCEVDVGLRPEWIAEWDANSEEQIERGLIVDLGWVEISQVSRDTTGWLGMTPTPESGLVQFTGCPIRGASWAGWWLPRRGINVGEKVRLQIAVDKLLWFAAGSGENLGKVES